MKTFRKFLKLVFIIFGGLNAMQLNAQEDYILDFDISADVPHYLTSTKFFGLSFRNPYCSNFKLTEIGAHIDSTSSSGVVKFALYNNLNVDHRELLWESGEVAVTGGVNEYVYADIPEGDIVLEDMHFYIIAMIGNPDGEYIKVKKKIAPENNGVAINHSNSTAGQYTNINYPDFPDSTYLQIAWYGAVNMVAKGVPDFVTITPNETSLDTLKGECVTVTESPTAIASCGGTISATTEDPLEYHHDGVFNITWTFKKGYYYAVEQVQTVVVDDVTAPIIPALPDLSGECSVVATAPSTTDACAGTITGTTDGDTIFSEVGDYTITWSFDDGNGNSVQAAQNVSVVDTVAPEIPALPDLSGECSVVATAPSTTDACAGIIAGTTTDVTTFTEPGDYIITWTFDDGNGNSIYADQNIIIEDAVSPTIDCVSDQTIRLTGDTTSYAVIGSEFDPNVDDNCGIDSIYNDINNSSTLDGVIFSAGTTSVTWIATDMEGNRVECSYDIVVEVSTSSKDYKTMDEFLLFPNPTTGKVFIKSIEAAIQEIIVTDISGVVQMKKTTLDKNDTIDISYLKGGLYIIYIKTEKNTYYSSIIKLD